MSFLLTSLAAIVFVANAEVTVRYFDSRGRAEAIRLTLSALEIDYNEIKYDRCGDKCSVGGPGTLYGVKSEIYNLELWFFF